MSDSLYSGDSPLQIVEAYAKIIVDDEITAAAIIKSDFKNSSTFQLRCHKLLKVFDCLLLEILRQDDWRKHQRAICVQQCSCD